MYGLLGENGAGKTTTVEILEGFRRTNVGVGLRARLRPGRRRSIVPRPDRHRPAVLRHRAGAHRGRGARPLRRAATDDRRTVDECVGLVGLDESVDKRCDRLSGGQRRRLDLALGIIGYPDLLFLDEPTTGFDPAARRGAWDLIRSLCAGGATVLLTSHYLDEVEHLADRVGVLRRGRLIAEGSPGELAGGNR